MTEILFSQNVDRKFTGFVSKGHSCFKRRGKDVVCAAISALTITAVNSLEEVAGAGTDVNSDEPDGMISCRLITDPDDKTETIFRSLVLGLRGIEAEYGDRYCKVTIKEELPC